MFRMARATATVSFQVRCRIHFKIIVGVYYVYQFAWSSEAGEKLFPKQDSSPDVIAYDKYSVGIYQKNQEWNH